MKRAMFLAAILLSWSLAFAGADEVFLEKAAISAMFEVQAGEIAKGKASTPELRRFAEAMVSDHTELNTQLGALAQRKGAVLPPRLDMEHAEKLKMLRDAKEGDDFDERYADVVEEEHDRVIPVYETAAKQATDAEVKALAAATLTQLKSRQDEANKLDRANLAR